MKSVKYNNLSCAGILEELKKCKEFTCDFHGITFDGEYQKGKVILKVNQDHNIKRLKLIPNVEFQFWGGYLNVEELIMEEEIIFDALAIKAKKVDIPSISRITDIDISKVTHLKITGHCDITNGWGAEITLHMTGRVGQLKKVMYDTSGWMYFSRKATTSDWEELDSIFNEPINRIALDGAHKDYIIERRGDWSKTFNSSQFEPEVNKRILSLIYNLAMKYKPKELSPRCTVGFRVGSFSIK